jgi:hypothetical protein
MAKLCAEQLNAAFFEYDLDKDGKLEQFIMGTRKTVAKNLQLYEYAEIRTHNSGLPKYGKTSKTEQ